MSTYHEGDIITLAFDDQAYMLAKVVYVEKLTLHDVLHLLIYDTLLEAGPPGYNQQGEAVPRTHTLPNLADLKVTIDHFAITSPAFMDCDPLVVEHQAVNDQERQGYMVWVTMRREQALRRGLIRHDVEEEVDEEIYDEEEWLEEDDAENGEEQDELEEETVEDDDVVEGEDKSTAEYEQVKVHTWHDTVFEVPVGQALIELSDIFKQEEFAESALAASILERTEASGEEIQGLIRQLVEEGDYGAGQELLMYGDPAADALNTVLKPDAEQQTVEDILQILGDMGSDRAYEHIAAFFIATIDRLPEDQVAVAAARAFCYVVMLTGGTPDTLHPHLKLLERLDYPDLREDAENAIEAIHSQGTDVPDPGMQSTSADPFGSL